MSKPKTSYWSSGNCGSVVSLWQEVIGAEAAEIAGEWTTQFVMPTKTPWRESPHPQNAVGDFYYIVCAKLSSARAAVEQEALTMSIWTTLWMPL